MSITRKQMAAFWTALGEALGSGTPLGQALRAAGGSAGGDAADLADKLAAHVEKGETLSAAMRDAGVFDDRVTAAVARAEEQGVLDCAAADVARAVERDDLDSLAGPAELRGPAPEAKAYVDALLRQASEAGASDIHIEPTEDGRGRVRLRIDGVLHHADPPEERLYHEVVAALKLLGAMDPAERSLPQDGRIRIRPGGERLDLRVSTLPAAWGESVTMRLLKPDAVIVPLDRAAGGENLAAIRELSRLPSGLVLVTGPVGCGKTTLLYGMLMEMDRDRNRVISIEDPVEFNLPGVTQVQIRPQIGLTFQRAQRHALRQDPDVILVGEIRNLEIVHIAVQTAMTGHLVLSTLHADTAVGAVRRLLDMSLEPFLLNSVLSGVISMRLVRRLCPECRRPGEPPSADVLPPEAAEILSRLDRATFHEPVGCDACRQTGYRGRMAIYEILRPDDRLRQLVSESADAGALRAAAGHGGMKSMLRDGLEKAARGLTTVEEVLRVAPRPEG
jgi:general secretion pathway protein E